MARITTPVNLTIARIGDQAKARVTYSIEGDLEDHSSGQTYIETCRLIGDDTPGDGTDDIINNGLLLRATTIMGPHTRFDRVLELTLPAANLDEDKGIFFPDTDEIRALVTLTPLLPTPQTSESNLVKFNEQILTT